MRLLLPCFVLASTALFTSTLTGCAMDDNSPHGDLREVDRVSALEGEWTLVAIDGRTLDLAESQVRRAPSLTIADDGAAGGFSGVNRFSGRISLDTDGDALFGPIAATKMAGPPGAMGIERAYFHAMNRVNEARVGGNRLVLLADGAEALAFERAE